MSSSDFRYMKRLYNQDILYDSGDPVDILRFILWCLMPLSTKRL
jgi:hypothetical protein